MLNHFKGCHQEHILRFNATSCLVGDLRPLIHVGARDKSRIDIAIIVLELLVEINSN